MNAVKRGHSQNWIIVAGLLLVAVILGRIEFRTPVMRATEEVVRLSIYVFLEAAWGISIKRRIMHRRIRHYLIHIDASLLFWLVVRTVKYYVIPNGFPSRFFEYLYYIPLLFIVVLAYMAVLCIGKEDVYKPERFRWLVLIPTFLLLTGILTNEMHQWAFRIDPVTGAVSYNWLYYITLTWIVLMCVVIVFSAPKYKGDEYFAKRKRLPYSVIGVGIIYAILYFIPATSKIMGSLEYTITVSAFVIILWESVISIGLVQANTDYKWCFYHSSIKAQVLDAKGVPIFRANDAPALVYTDFQELRLNDMVKPNVNTERFMSRIRGGYVVWERDIRDINRTLMRMRDAQKSIKNANDSLSEAISYEVKRKKINEQSRLYDLVFSKVGPKLDILSRLIKEAKRADGDRLSDLLRRIDIIGVYVKRKSNLILLSEKDDTDFFDELHMCFKETMDNLAKSGVDADFMFRGKTSLSYENALAVYDLLESVLEESFDILSSITAIVSCGGQGVVFTVSLDTKKADNSYANQISHVVSRSTLKPEMEFDDGILAVSALVAEGGDTL